MPCFSFPGIEPYRTNLACTAVFFFFIQHVFVIKRYVHTNGILFFCRPAGVFLMSTGFGNGEDLTDVF